MKYTYFLIISLFAFNFTAIAQEEDTASYQKIIIGDNVVITIKNNNDECDTVGSYGSSNDKIETTLGVDFGVTGYLTADGETSLSGAESIHDLDFKGKNIALNFLTRFNINKSLTLISGLGIEWNKYTYKENVNFSANNDTTILTIDSVNNFKVNKLRTTFLNVPLMVELGKPDKFNVQLGAILGVNLSNVVKQKIGDDKHKLRDDYNINPFRASLTARIRFGGFGIFGNYSLSKFYQNDKGPELYPFSVGLTFGGN